MPESSQVQLGAKRDPKAEDGNILVLTALGLTFLCGFLAMAVDAGRVLYTQRQLQTLADAAALAGAYEIGSCGSTANCTAMQNAAKSALTENGVTGITLATQCATSSASGFVLTLNNGPCTKGSSDPNYNSTNYVEAVVQMPVNTIFGGVLGTKSINVEARSEAGGTKPKYCGYILSPNAGNAMLINGNATIQASCGFIDNSNASPAAIFNGHDSISTTALDIVGSDINNGNNSITPAPKTGVSSVSDPLSSLPTPTIGSCGSGSGSSWSGSQSTAIPSSTATFNPGVYCGGIILNGNVNATFKPGTYVIEGNMIVNGSDSMTGSGVTFYFQSGSLTMNGGSHAALSAPTTGTYAGILYFQNRTDSSTIILNGDTTSSWQGAIYASDANLTLNGGSNVAAYTILVVSTYTQNGNVDLTIGSDYSSLPGGSPIRSNLLTYMVE